MFIVNNICYWYDTIHLISIMEINPELLDGVKRMERCTRMMRQTHQYCVNCGQNLHDYGQKTCIRCGSNLEKDESKTMDAFKAQKMTEKEYLEMVLSEHRRSRL